MNMLERLASFLALALITTAASAAPAITSVTPNSSAVTGGIHVTIKGDGFSACTICSPPSPPAVTFGLTLASSVLVLDPQTLDVVVPVHQPGTVDVNVGQFDGTATARNAFTFTGELSDVFETILLPIYSPPVHGAFGSEFHTIVRAANKSDVPVVLYGVDTSCTPIYPPQDPSQPFILTSHQDVQLPTDCSQWPAHLLYVRKADAPLLALNDRVLDVSRSSLSNGTEIPIVRPTRFTTNRIALLGVPIDGRFRNTLRVYGMIPMTLNVSIGGQQPRKVELKPGASMFEAAYGTFSDFLIPVDPGSESTVTVTIDPTLVVVGPTVITQPIWAFITVTNNETQQITTITPDN